MNWIQKRREEKDVEGNDENENDWKRRQSSNEIKFDGRKMKKESLGQEDKGK